MGGNAQNAFSAFVNHFNNIYDGIHPEGWRGYTYSRMYKAVRGKPRLFIDRHMLKNV